MFHVNNAFLMTSLREEEAAERSKDSGSVRTDILSVVLCLWCNQGSPIILFFFFQRMFSLFLVFFFYSRPSLSSQNHDGNGSSACLMNAPLKQQKQTTQCLPLLSHNCQHRSEGTFELITNVSFFDKFVLRLWWWIISVMTLVFICLKKQILPPVCSK